MLKKIVLIVCLILTASLFCSLKYNNNYDKNIIQFATWGSESEIKILKPVLHDFEQKNPNVKVNLLHIPQNYFQKIHLLFASNTAPDVIFMNNQYLPVYANAGVLEDLTPYKNELEFEKFYQKSLEALSWKNQVYAAPRDVSNLVIYYNKDIFDKYNVPYPKSGWSYDEFLEKAKKLTHNPDIFGISFDEEPLFYMPYLMGQGIDYIPDLEDSKVHNALQNYADLRHKYNIAPLKTDASSMTMAQMFLQGRLAMHLSGRWLVPKYREEARFDWDIIEFPTMNSNSKFPIDASGWVISKSSKHKPEAIKLVQYLSSKSSIEKFAKSGLIIPARVDCSDSILDGEKPENTKIFTDIIEISTPTPVSVNYREVLDKLKSGTERVFN
ncbi:MAG: sugar ABC transporter substrate-binding protein [Candidatus Gastranaerophilales bacterium]|nr:sugar ABC transporter substrate-binding protein [Candidatus Gastranaerophilales bacterium]